MSTKAPADSRISTSLIAAVGAWGLFIGIWAYLIDDYMAHTDKLLPRRDGYSIEQLAAMHPILSVEPPAASPKL